MRVSHARPNSRCGAALDAAPIDVGFNAKDELVYLPVVTDRAADQAAGGVERACRAERVGPIGVAPSATTVDTDVKAGPVVWSEIGWRLRRHGLPPRNVGCIRRLHHRQRSEPSDARQNQTLHSRNLRYRNGARIYAGKIFRIALASSAQKTHSIESRQLHCRIVNDEKSRFCLDLFSNVRTVNEYLSRTRRSKLFTRVHEKLICPKTKPRALDPRFRAQKVFARVRSDSSRRGAGSSSAIRCPRR